MAYLAPFLCDYAPISSSFLQRNPNLEPLALTSSITSFSDGIRPNDAKVATVTCIRMPTDKRRSLFGGYSYHSKLLSNMAQGIHPVMALLKKAACLTSLQNWNK